MSNTYNILKSIKPKEVLGNPKDALRGLTKEQAETDGYYIPMGVIFGRATGVGEAKRTKPNGDVDTWENLTGQFEGMSFDPKATPGRAPTAYLPDHIHGAIKSQLKSETNPDGGIVVEFAFEVGVEVNSKSATGFVWRYTSKQNPTAGDEVDPLAALRMKALPAPKQEAPEVEKMEDDKPAAKAHKK